MKIVTFVGVLLLIIYLSTVHTARLEVCKSDEICDLHHNLTRGFFSRTLNGAKNYFTNLLELSKCKYREPAEALSMFDRYFDKLIVGQREAIAEIRAALQTKLYNPRRKVVLHFAGPNGVGKSFATRLISYALCKYSADPFTGANYIVVSGEDYRDYKTKDSFPAARNKLYDDVMNRIKGCAASIIVIDEIQKMHPQVLAKLVPLFDGASGPSEAIIILTSDFKREELEQIQTERDYVTLRKLVIEFSRSVYEDDENKLPGLITHTIPFFGLNDNELATLAANQLSWLPCAPELASMGLKCIEYDSNLPSQIVKRYVTDQLGYGENARGFNKTFTPLVEHPVFMELRRNVPNTLCTVRLDSMMSALDKNMLGLVRTTLIPHTTKAETKPSEQKRKEKWEL